MWELLGAALILGLAGFDPAGFLIALTALTAGARDRTVVAFAVVVIAGTAVLGVVLSLTVGQGLQGVDWASLAPPDWLAAVVELAVAVALLAWAAIRLRRPDARPPRPGKSRSGSALIGGGALFALGAVFDPAFVGLVVVAGRDPSVLEVIAAHLVWILVSQVPLVLLAVAVVAGRHERVVARAQVWMSRIRPALARAGTVTLVAAGVLLALDVVVWFVTGRFLLFP